MTKDTRKKVLLTFLTLFIFSLFGAGLAIGFHNRGMSWLLTEARLFAVACCFSCAWLLFSSLRSGYFSRLTDEQADRAMTALLFFLSLQPAILSFFGYRFLGWIWTD